VEAYAGSIPEGCMLQRRIELRKTWNLPERLLGNLFGIGLGTLEYRTHVVAGRIVPYATRCRGCLWRYAWGILVPWRPGYEKAAERFSEAVLRSASEDVSDMTFGFDVALDTDGLWWLVEANPSVGGIGSSWFSSPLVVDAVLALFRKRAPRWVVVKRVLWCLLLLAAAYLAL
jgi:hypothetical protein